MHALDSPSDVFWEAQSNAIASNGVCGKQFGKFIPYVNRYAVSVTADIISGQSISANKCPCCESYDRERGLYFYFRENVAFAGKRVLHIAPEDSLHSLLASAGCAEYVCGDLDPRSYYPVSSSIRTTDIGLVGDPAQKNARPAVARNPVTSV